MKKNLDLGGYEYVESKLPSKEKTLIVIILTIMVAFTLTSCAGSKGCPSYNWSDARKDMLR